MLKLRIFWLLLLLTLCIAILGGCTTATDAPATPETGAQEPLPDEPAAEEPAPSIAGLVSPVATGGYIPANPAAGGFLFRLVEDEEYAQISEQISGLEDAEARRAEYIAGLEDFRYAEVEERQILEAATVNEFTVLLHTDLSTEEAEEVLFYELRYGEQSMLIPAEAGMRLGNIRYSADRLYFYSQRDIWRITEDERAVALTNPTYEGKTLEEMWQAKQDNYPEAGLPFWVDEPTVSPDGRYLAYMSNRDTWPEDSYSVWLYDTQEQQESLLLSGAGAYRRPLGWLDEQTLLVENTIPGEYSTYSLVQPDGSLTAAALSEGQPEILDIRDGLLAHLVDYEVDELTIAISRYLPQEKRLEALAEIPVGESWIEEGKLSPAGRYFAYLGSGWQEALYFYQIAGGSRYALSHEQLPDFTENTQIRDFYWLDEHNLLIISEDSPDGGAFHYTTWWFALEDQAL